MIIPRHRVCNLCGEEVGINKRYFVVKSKTIHNNCKYDICEDCMREFAKYLQSKWEGKEE